MSTTYKYNHGLPHHVVRHVLVIGGLSLVIIAAAVLLLFLNSHQKPSVVSGGSATVPQPKSQQAVLQINEPLFTMQLPSDWKQTASASTAAEHSISWQATTKNADNRYLKIYIDTIPATYPVNRELPLTAHGSQLVYGSLSDNCATFTPGGTLDTGKAVKLQPTAAVWQGINFICNLQNVVDNQIGTGSSAGVNTVTLTGPQSGKHSYFFLYTDRNIQPDYEIFYDAIQSFRAK